MATPKGTRVIRLPVNGTDSVHVYSDATHIWLQLRRGVPTEVDIGRSSFKVALCLALGTAEQLGVELLNVVKRNKEKQKTASKSPEPKQKATSTAQK